MPRLLPSSSKRAIFSAPPLEVARTKTFPFKLAISGAKLRASSATRAALPWTCTVSTRFSPGAIAAESASNSKLTSVTENSGAVCLPQETSTVTAPFCCSKGASTVIETGEDASTMACLPPIITWLESASPQNPLPASAKRSLIEAIRGACVTRSEGEDASAGVKIVVGTLPARPSKDPKMTPGFSGATNNARPVASVVYFSPLEK